MPCNDLIIKTKELEKEIKKLKQENEKIRKSVKRVIEHIKFRDPEYGRSDSYSAMKSDRHSNIYGFHDGGM